MIKKIYNISGFDCANCAAKAENHLGKNKNIEYARLDFAANKLYLTEVHKSCRDADVFFPKFNKRLYNKSIVGTNEDNNIKYDFVVYEKKLILKK